MDPGLKDLSTMTFVRPPREMRREKAQQMTQGLVILLVLCVLFSFYFSFRETFEIPDHHKILNSGKEFDADRPQLDPEEVKLLQPEDLFHQTIKSCLPEENKKCKLYIPEKTTAERIAVMAPPGDFAVNFYRLLEAIVTHAQKTQKVEIQLIPTTHVPPYGYGKTHGWTRIIRVVPRPLLFGATNALDFISREGDSVDSITIDDIKSSLRLQMRYHCRLSHVSAHTALMSIELEKGLLSDAGLDSLIHKLQSFLGVNQGGAAEEIVGRQSAHGGGIEPLDAIYDRIIMQGIDMLTRASAPTIGIPFFEVLNDVLLEEMRISKNMTGWPCESFWTVGSQEVLKLSPTVTQIAKSMSPDCESNFTSCWVDRDLCEAAGDGKCMHKKK